MKKIVMICCLLGGTMPLPAQSDAKAIVEQFNRRIDSAVVKKDLKNLGKWYADDFVFTHGTGLVEGKAGWLNTVGDTATHFLSRTHDSLATEVHRRVAIVHGKLSVSRLQLSGKTTDYELWYVRVFAQRKRNWQLISHRTVKERHLN